MAENTTALSTTARGATFLIAVQIASKALTFALNQLVLLRYLSPALLGASVQLELYKIGVLYFSRESLRVATERRSGGGVQAAVNLSYLAILAGVPIGLGAAEWYLRVGHPDVPFFVEALRVNGVAAVVELCKEPAFVAVQQRMLYKIRAAAEVPGVMMKTFATAGLVFWGRSQGIDLGVLPFAAGEFANSATMAVIYLYQTSRVAKREGFSLLPTKMKSSPETTFYLSYLSAPLLSLTASLYFQTAIKWALTEGDKLLIASFASLEAQGTYALAANYGGFLARMVFKPIEESARNLFANLCSAPAEPPEKRTEKQGKRSKSSESKPDSASTNPDIHTAARTLHLLLKTYTLLSLPLLTLAPPLIPHLFSLLLGAHWTNPSPNNTTSPSTSNATPASVLSTYTLYVPLLALNGVSEAFVAAVASPRDLRTQSLVMALFSVLFGGSSWVFVRHLGYGARGLVWANCVNMGLRIVFNLGFVGRWFAGRGVEFGILGILPSPVALGVAAVVPSLISRTTDLEFLRPYGIFGELLRIGGIGVVFLGVLAVAERKFLLDCWGRMRG